MTNIELALIDYDGNSNMPHCDLVFDALKLMQKVVYCKDCMWGRAVADKIACPMFDGEKMEMNDFCSFGHKEGD